MGEYAEMMLDGTCCAGCGEFFHDGEDDGFPRYCECCEPDEDDDAPKGQNANNQQPRTSKKHPGKIRREKERRFRRRAERRAQLDAADKTGWDKITDYHYRKMDGENRIDWYPSTGKWSINNVIQLTKKVN